MFSFLHISNSDVRKYTFNVSLISKSDIKKKTCLSFVCLNRTLIVRKYVYSFLLVTNSDIEKEVLNYLLITNSDV